MPEHRPQTQTFRDPGMLSPQANAYLRTQVMSASPEELRLMLLDGAVKFATQGVDGLEAKDYELSFAGFSRARDIVLELMTTIRREADPELADRVKAVYAFIYQELVEASFEKDVARARKTVELLQFERETWAMLMDRLASERRSGAPGAPTGSPAAPSAPTAPTAPTAPSSNAPRRPLSLSA